MSHPDLPPWFRPLSALAGAILFTASLRAQSPLPGFALTNAPPALAARLQPGETLGNEQVVREFLRCGTNEFVFVVPEETRAEAALENQLVLSSWQQGYHLTLRVWEPPAAATPLREVAREHLAREYPQAGSVEEFETTVAGQPGRGFQFRLGQAGGSSQLVRIVYVPFRAGLLAFTLNARPNSLAAGRRAFDQVLLTFRSNEAGKLEIIKRSQQT